MSFDWNGMMMVYFSADALWACFSQVLQCAVNEFVPVTVRHNLSKRVTLTTPLFRVFCHQYVRT